MSQFIFGEFVAPSNMKQVLKKIISSQNYPFSLKFEIGPHNYYHRLAPKTCAVVPFVITDAFDDNNAELLLYAELHQNQILYFPESYSNILALSLQDRMASLVSALREIMINTNSECLLALSDGLEIQIDYEECVIDELETKLINLVNSNQIFSVATFWIK